MTLLKKREITWNRTAFDRQQRKALMEGCSLQWMHNG